MPVHGLRRLGQSAASLRVCVGVWGSSRITRNPAPVGKCASSRLNLSSAESCDIDPKKRYDWPRESSAHQKVRCSVCTQESPPIKMRASGKLGV